MTDEERSNRIDDRTDATIDFINWIKEKNKKKIETKQSLTKKLTK